MPETQLLLLRTFFILCKSLSKDITRIGFYSRVTKSCVVFFPIHETSGSGMSLKVYLRISQECRKPSWFYGHITLEIMYLLSTTTHVTLMWLPKWHHVGARVWTFLQKTFILIAVPWKEFHETDCQSKVRESLWLDKLEAKREKEYCTTNRRCRLCLHLSCGDLDYHIIRGKQFVMKQHR